MSTPEFPTTARRNRRYLILTIAILIAGAILALVAYNITAAYTRTSALPAGPSVGKVSTQPIHGTVLNRHIEPARTDTTCAAPLLGACAEIHVPRQYLIRVRADNGSITQWQATSQTRYSSIKVGEHI